MCGRYTLTVEDRFLRELFEVSLEDCDYAPNYNICPGAEMPVIYSDGTEAKKSARLMRWGLIPKWAKEAAVGYKMINARAETLHERPAYKLPFARQRCLVPADGFYEWQKDTKGKTPYRIILPQGGLFAFAGLWDCWLTPEGMEVYSFAIVTTDANAGLQHIHNRMPLILADNASRQTWLDLGTPQNELKQLLTPYKGGLVSYRVSPLVNSPRNNHAQLVESIDSLDS